MGLIEKAIAKDMEKRAAKAGQVAEIVDKIVAVLGDHPLVEYKECCGYSIRIAMYVCGDLLVTFERRGRELVFGGAGEFSKTLSWDVPESRDKLAAAIAGRICRANRVAVKQDEKSPGWTPKRPLLKTDEGVCNE